MAALVPAIPIIGARCPPDPALLIEIAGTSPAMTNRLPRVLPLLHPEGLPGRYPSAMV